MNTKSMKRCLGLSLIGWVILIPFIFIGLIVLVFIGCELNKAYWDHKVRKMCEEDGGITIYEKVTITEEEYKRLGGIKGSIPIPSVDDSNSDTPFFYERRRTTIRESFPEAWKSVAVVKRRSDGKTLGQAIHYSRRGGDFPTGLAHDSSYGCPDNVSFEKQIFHVKGEQK